MALIDAGVLAALEKEFVIRAAESNDTSISAEASYNLGLALVFASRTERINEGIALLGGLLLQGYRTSDVIFYQCVGLMHAGRYRECRSQLVALVSSEPTNERAAALLHLYKTRVASDSTTGFLIYAGVGAAVIALAYLAYRYYTGSTPAGSSAPVIASAVAAPVAPAAPAAAGVQRTAPQPGRLSADSRVTLTRMSRG